MSVKDAVEYPIKKLLTLYHQRGHMEWRSQVVGKEKIVILAPLKVRC